MQIPNTCPSSRSRLLYIYRVVRSSLMTGAKILVLMTAVFLVGCQKQLIEALESIFGTSTDETTGLCVIQIPARVNTNFDELRMNFQDRKDFQEELVYWIESGNSPSTQSQVEIQYVKPVDVRPKTCGPPITVNDNWDPIDESANYRLCMQRWASQTQEGKLSRQRCDASSEIFVSGIEIDRYSSSNITVRPLLANYDTGEIRILPTKTVTLSSENATADFRALGYRAGRAIHAELVAQYKKQQAQHQTENQ